MNATLSSDTTTASSNSAAFSLEKGLSVENPSFEEGKIYQPSGKFEVSGLPMMLGAGALAGIVVGLVYHFVSGFFDLLILFPLIAGACAGGLVALAVTKGKVRSPKMAGFIGGLSGVLLWAVMQLAGAYSVRPMMIEGLTQASLPLMISKNGVKHQLTSSETAAFEKEARQEVEGYLSPVRTVMLYEKVRGEAGSSLKHNGVGEGIKLSGMAFWGLEAFEVLLMLGAACAIAAGAASKPFCENCDVWHQNQPLLKVHPTQNSLLWEKIHAKDWNGLMNTPVGQTMDSKNETTLSLSRCPNCDCATISATSAGGTVPAEIQNRQLSPESARSLLAIASAPVAGTGS